jgi:CRP/FNR family cyclic AMP-dependent transcriptional regulator
MQVSEINELDTTEIDSFLSRIPLYREIRSRDAEQFERLMRFSRRVEMEPGELIMRRGDKGSWLYFLLVGQLAVYTGNGESEEVALNYISPGEMFGDLALLGAFERRVTVRTDRQVRRAVLLATDFGCFGRLTDFALVSLPTKLAFYRLIAKGIRWRLELKKMEQPDHPLALEMRSVSLFNGQPNTEDELQFLHRQACELAGILTGWHGDMSRPDMLSFSSAHIDPAMLS